MVNNNLFRCVRKIGVKPASGSQAYGSSTKNINCEKVVKHQIKLVSQELKKQKDELTISLIGSPDAIAFGIKSCREDLKDPKKAAIWACQARASSARTMKACEK